MLGIYFAVFLFPTSAVAWKIDSGLKFSYGFFHTGHMHGHVWSKALNFKGPGLPDITNINLRHMLNLGYPIPHEGVLHPGNMLFFVKYYAYPKDLSARVSFSRIQHSFLLDSFKELRAVAAYASKTTTAVVKVGYLASQLEHFSKVHPFPKFRVRNQLDFDAHVPFVSLYLLPSKDKALTSAVKNQMGCRPICRNILGVIAFHQKLRAYYANHYKHIHTDEGKDVFLGYRERMAIVVTVPKKPLIFASDWIEHPMPQADNMFLSSLLLITSDQYAEGKRLQSYGDVLRAVHQSRTILEIGSVYRKP